MNRLHLLCNAHIDPVWQWEWEEGAAAAISTFRIAARFCEKYDNFVFNHNEAILYKFIEEYEPSLFKKIQQLVAKGKWNIMGGWYLQPDCNMPSGESLLRQILLGRAYFMEKFKSEPKTAIGFDAFGHSRGLVQIMKKSGFDSYIFLRPMDNELNLPGQDFIWVGYDESEVYAHRISKGYATNLGLAAEKILDWIEENKQKELGMITWGVGNHGGGPSRIDLENIGGLMRESTGFEIIHSTPEAYFKELAGSKTDLKRYDKDLNPKNVGCYTSQIRIKQKHRLLENELYMSEKMSSYAFLQYGMAYPEKEIKDAFCDLLTSEFHDILPGTSVQQAEEASLRLLDHGLEIASRIKTRAFFALSSGQKAVNEGMIPIIVYNPHPFKIRKIIECEFVLPNQNLDDNFSVPTVFQGEKQIPSQLEKENSNINMDWRKRVVFIADLEPCSMNRFDCKNHRVDKKPEPLLKKDGDRITFVTGELEVVVNCLSGLIDVYKANGINYLMKNAFSLLVIDDNEDPWGMTVNSFRNVLGEFKLMSREEGMKFSGLRGSAIDSVRVIEDGDVRCVIEAVFKYGNSFACMTYKLPKQGTEIMVQVRVYWNEKDKMLKLSVPTVFKDSRHIGQTAYGVKNLQDNGDEDVSQKWTAVISQISKKAFTCINDCIYGSDFKDGEVRISLLRSPGYTAHPIEDRTIMVQDRFLPRIDQGERSFNFWFNAGKTEERLAGIDREALTHNEKPFALSYFPSGEGTNLGTVISLDDKTIQITAFKKAENADEFIIRLFEPTGIPGETTIHLHTLGISQNVKFSGFEIKTYRLNIENRKLTEVGPMER